MNWETRLGEANRRSTSIPWASDFETDIASIHLQEMGLMSVNELRDETSLNLLLSCSNDYEKDLIIGLLRDNGVAAYFESGLEVPTNCRIFVNRADLWKAQQILAASNKVFEGIEENPQLLPKRSHRIILRVLLFLTFLFFGAVAHYIFRTTKDSMRFVMGGISLFFLLVFIFSFHLFPRKKKGY